MIEHLLPSLIQSLICTKALLSHVHHLPCSRVHGNGPLVSKRSLLGLLLGLGGAKQNQKALRKTGLR